MDNGRKEKYHIHISAKQKMFELNLKEVWQYRDLIVLFTKRNFLLTYKQTILGPAWIFLNPFISSIIYTIVFGGIAGMSTDGVPKILFYLKNVKFRFEIQFQDGTIAGTMFTSNGVDFNNNDEKEITLEMDTAHLTAGKYNVDIVAFVYDKFGNEGFLDGVYPGFVFEIDEKLNEHNELVWLHQYWGHVHLHNVEIINERMI